MKTIDLGFTTLELYNNYFIGRTNNGVNLSMEKHLNVLEVLKQNLTAPFGMIIDVVNNYSVDFDVFQHISTNENINCIGVIYHRPETKISLEIGQMIIQKPVYFSRNRDYVTKWVEQLIAY